MVKDGRALSQSIDEDQKIIDELCVEKTKVFWLQYVSEDLLDFWCSGFWPFSSFQIHLWGLPSKDCSLWNCISCGLTPFHVGGTWVWVLEMGFWVAMYIEAAFIKDLSSAYTISIITVPCPSLLARWVSWNFFHSLANNNPASATLLLNFNLPILPLRAILMDGTHFPCISGYIVPSPVVPRFPQAM